MRRPGPGRVLVDTGPLVAILDDRDAHHKSCVQALALLDGPLYTCWPVLTEAAWLLRHSPDAVRRLLKSIDTDFVHLLSLAGSEARPIAELLSKYKSLRPQLADAAVVYLASRERIETIFTLDRRDFSIYRTKRGRSFRILPDS
ncbi:MAG: PIN domain-containing protein [Candidatus Sulfotelmatobacter sp.]